MNYEAEAGNITLVATGDSIINRKLSVFRESGFEKLLRLIREGDVRFTNLETLVHEYDLNPGATAGGTFMASPPSVLGELQWAGFNLVSCANNHSYDYGEGGLLTTLRHLQASGLAHAGTGRNLAEARSPGYLDTPAGRVALISTSSTFVEAARATDQRPDLQGHPGLNPLRFSTTYTVDAPAFEQVRRMSRELGMETEKAWRARMGTLFAGPDTATGFHFLERTFVPGEGFRVQTEPNRHDLEGNLRVIEDARKQADWVLVTAHCHEFGPNLEDPPEFLRAFAHACIDAGADAFIGHGPHFVKGIEVYRGVPVLYSLGNFIFQNEHVSRQPAENYARYGLDHSALPGQFYEARSAGDTRGFPADPEHRCPGPLRGPAAARPAPVSHRPRLQAAAFASGPPAARPRRGRPCGAGPDPAPFSASRHGDIGGRRSGRGQAVGMLTGQNLRISIKASPARYVFSLEGTTVMGTTCHCESQAAVGGVAGRRSNPDPTAARTSPEA